VRPATRPAHLEWTHGTGTPRSPRAAASAATGGILSGQTSPSALESLLIELAARAVLAVDDGLRHVVVREVDPPSLGRINPRHAALDAAEKREFEFLTWKLVHVALDFGIGGPLAYATFV